MIMNDVDQKELQAAVTQKLSNVGNYFLLTIALVASLTFLYFAMYYFAMGLGLLVAFAGANIAYTYFTDDSDDVLPEEDVWNVNRSIRELEDRINGFILSDMITSQQRALLEDHMITNVQKLYIFDDDDNDPIRIRMFNSCYITSVEKVKEIINAE